MQAYLVNCNHSKVEKSAGHGDAILLYLDYDDAKRKRDQVNEELGGEFFQVVEVSVEVV